MLCSFVCNSFERWVILNAFFLGSTYPGKEILHVCLWPLGQQEPPYIFSASVVFAMWWLFAKLSFQSFGPKEKELTSPIFLLLTLLLGSLCCLVFSSFFFFHTLFQFDLNLFRKGWKMSKQSGSLGSSEVVLKKVQQNDRVLTGGFY